MTGKIEYKRSGKKLLKVETVEVNEKRIKSKITRLSNELKHAAGIDLQDLLKKHLTKRERQTIQFLLKGCRQQEIAGKMKISQVRVSFLLKRAVGKLKVFFIGGL